MVYEWCAGVGGWEEGFTKSLESDLDLGRPSPNQRTNECLLCNGLIRLTRVVRSRLHLSPAAKGLAAAFPFHRKERARGPNGRLTRPMVLYVGLADLTTSFVTFFGLTVHSKSKRCVE